MLSRRRRRARASPWQLEQYRCRGEIAGRPHEQSRGPARAGRQLEQYRKGFVVWASLKVWPHRAHALVTMVPAGVNLRRSRWAYRHRGAQNLLRGEPDSIGLLHHSQSRDVTTGVTPEAE